VASVNKNTPTRKVPQFLVSSPLLTVLKLFPFSEGKNMKVAKTKYGSGLLSILGNKPRA
jgi:hypothetical protein